MAVSLVVAGNANRTKRYTRIPMIDAHNPNSVWTAYVHPGFTHFHPVNGTDEDREKRAKVYAYVTGGEYKCYVKPDGWRQHVVRVPHSVDLIGKMKSVEELLED